VNTVTSRLSRWVAGFIAVALVAGGSLIAVTPASAAPATVTGGNLDWGVAADYRAVFTTRGVGAGATQTATDTFSFPAATTSTYDPATKSGTLNFTGNARIGYMAGFPQTPGVVPGNYFYLSNPVVTINGSTGTLSGVTAGDSHKTNPELPTAAQAVRTVANLDFSAVTPTVNADGTLITFAAVPATITEAGTSVLATFVSASDSAAGKRVAGSALDPVTIQLAVTAPVAPAVATTTSLAAPATAAVGSAVSLTATVAPAGAVGSVEFFDGATSLATVPVASGTATTTATFSTAGAHSVTAKFTPTDAAAFVASTSAASTVAATTGPKVTISKSTVSSAGETITVTGTGFTPNVPATNGARPPLAGKFGGAYVTFGKFADTWKASAGAPSSARVADRTTTKWFLNAEDVATVGGASAGAVAIGADGSFSIDIPVKPGFSGEPATGNYGIYTYAGSGAVYAPFETYTPITFASPKVTISKSTVSSAGETVTVTGTGFTPNAPATNGARPPLAGKFGGAYVTFGKFADTWKASAGAPSSARAADRTTTKWFLNAEDVATVGGASAGAVAIGADGSFSIDIPVKPGFSGEPATGNYGIYTYAGSGAVYAPFETYTPITFATSQTKTTLALTATPTAVTAGNATALTAKVTPVTAGTVTFSSGGTTVGVVPVDASGTASQVTPPIAAGTTTFTATFAPADPKLFAGSTTTVPVVATPAAPSTASLDWGVKKSFRDYITGPIAHGSVTAAGVTDNNGIYNFPYKTGGSFDATTALGTALYSGSLHFYGHDGQLDITFSDPSIRVTGPKTGTLAVKVDGGAAVTIATLDLAAATATSTATSASFAGAPATLTEAGGVAFGGFYPAGTALDAVTFTIDTTVPVDPTVPVEPEVPLPPVVQATSLALSANPATLTAGGSTSLAAQVAPVTAGTVTFAAGNTVLGTVAVSSTGGASFTVDNLPVGVSEFSATFTPADTTLFSASTATAAVSVAAQSVGAGSLAWGVKESFRSYVTGPIAKGAVTTSGVASSGGIFTFGQAAGGTFDRATGVGTSNYSGSVRFTGHAGQLDITLSNPVVRVDSATSGTLLVSVNGGASTPFATLNLAAAARSTPNNTVSYSGVPASLTSQGAAVFSLNGSGFYAVGSALDPVSFVVGAPNVVNATVGATVASFKGAANVPAATPPATTGIAIAQGTALKAGDEVTITASGFQPNETGILVVIYSTPTVLDTNATADATGTVTWTGRLPAGLSGVHTLTFQGSVDRGVELTIEPAELSAAVAGCVVDDATLTWGFKESFRAYISGAIAKGEWTVADGATYAVPSFGFSAGTGGYDAESGEGAIAFPGSITFTGHGGVLNTRVSNPQITFVDADTALLLLDVSGTTQDGAAVDNKAVEFAEIDLAGVLENDEGAVTITAAPAVLTEAGAGAIGTYPAGEALDPISIAFTTAADCAVPVDDAAAPATTSAETVSAESPADFGWIVWAIIALVVVLAAVVAIVLVRRRRA